MAHAIGVYLQENRFDMNENADEVVKMKMQETVGNVFI